MLDFWVTVGSLALVCQMSITSGGGLERSELKLSSCLVTETLFLLHFCHLLGALLLASRFDMEGKTETFAFYVNMIHSMHPPLRMNPKINIHGV